ncbi:unnamed protein product [Polarella glacialis]|uniref:SAM-dependent MTase RsmB/NOP-type domain-containing protein n=1 Tax=Polarella glacialis TaxID=89957 RepID=A0A813GFP9_POLGL|nr:unnamed protein product [Polarella glacialis]
MRRAPLAPRSFLAHLDRDWAQAAAPRPSRSKYRPMLDVVVAVVVVVVIVVVALVVVMFLLSLFLLLLLLLETVRLGLKTLELRRLLRACARPSRKSFRINSIKAQPDLLARLKAEGWQMSPVPWHSDGFFVEAAPAGDLLGRSRPHLTGEIYFQEATSMLPGEVLRAVLSTLEVSSSRRLRVLDACAAPGSKSTQLGNWLEGQEGLLVANEADPVRAEILRTNLLRAGVVNCLVTCSDGRDLGDLAPELFDAVLMDVPCSCEGNARKDPGSLLRGSGGAPSNDGTPPIWHRSLVEKQWELIRSGWRALRPGGYLVYSTCTFNQWENEAQCMKLLEADAATELGGFRASAVDIAAVLNFPPSAASAVRGIAPLPSEKAQGQRSKGQTQISPESARLGVQLGALRLSPQSFDVEGFFVSCFRKEGSTGAHEEFFGTRSKPAASASTAMAPSYASDLRPLSASEVVKLRSLAQSCLGFWPESESESKKTKSNLWEDPRSGEIWLLPDLGPPGLEVLARHAKAPGLLVARRGRCSDPASRLELSDELMLVAGDRVGSAAGLSTSEWAELLSRVESGRHISPGRSERIGNMVAEETVDEEEEDVIGY